MTRFEKELSGAIGEFWKKHAEEEIAKMQARVNNNEICIDAEGGAFWSSNGRYLPADCAEILAHTDFHENDSGVLLVKPFSIDATTKAREAQNAAFIANYRRNHRTTAEECMEARNELGPNAINIITGERI